jgi:hypothetical protein
LHFEDSVIAWIVTVMSPTQARGRTRRIIRWVLGGPVTAIVAVIALMGMPIYIPAGVGNVDNLVIPLLLFPLIWAMLFFHAVLDSNLARVALVAALIAGGNLTLLAARFWS